MAGWWRDTFIVFLKGMAMGIADAVPGVSGGTIAVISGIYERLVNALRHCHPFSLNLIRTQGWSAFWRHIDGRFLVSLGAGILCSLVMMANIILWLLADYRALVMCFFIGLVLASCVLLKREAPSWNVSMSLLFIAGFTLTVLTGWLEPLVADMSLVYLFMCGMIAICAMILPGISGAFILILLGVYEYVLDALRTFDSVVIIVFAAGCVLGLLTFSHILAWTFFYYRQQTYAVLIGMLSASVVVMWPGEAFSNAGWATALVAAIVMVTGAGVIALFARISGLSRDG
jgi:putative membrane protein